MDLERLAHRLAKLLDKGLHSLARELEELEERMAYGLDPPPLAPLHPDATKSSEHAASCATEEPPRTNASCAGSSAHTNTQPKPGPQAKPRSQPEPHSGA